MVVFKKNHFVLGIKYNFFDLCDGRNISNIRYLWLDEVVPLAIFLIENIFH